jgi:hypothetical protein
MSSKKQSGRGRNPEVAAKIEAATLKLIEESAEALRSGKFDESLERLDELAVLQGLYSPAVAERKRLEQELRALKKRKEARP